MTIPNFLFFLVGWSFIGWISWREYHNHFGKDEDDGKDK